MVVVADADKVGLVALLEFDIAESQRLDRGIANQRRVVRDQGIIVKGVEEDKFARNADAVSKGDEYITEADGNGISVTDNQGARGMRGDHIARPVELCRFHPIYQVGQVKVDGHKRRHEFLGER